MDTEALLQYRQNKDQMAKSENSPLPIAMRAKFAGLSYFTPNPDLIFEGEIELFPENDEIQLAKTDGKMQALPRYGRFSFEVDGIAQSLIIIKAGEERFGILFKDATSGHETYGGGRSVEAVRVEGNRFRVDFNYAENQMCAYASIFACPLPPLENYLSVPIRAGEKTPTGDWLNAE